MESLTCTQVQQFLREATTPGSPAAAAAIREHLRSCPVCQAALLLITALDLPVMPASIGCGQCQKELAAYIDLEQRAGIHSAARSYPNTWWHLWSCPDCLEIYDITAALVDATQQGALALPGSGTLTGRLIHLLRLTRQFLTIALPPQPALARGGADDAMVLSEGPAMDGAHYFLTVTAEPSGMWRISVTVTPPPAGILRLSIGDALFRARFDAAGQAIVSAVPGALLADVNGPDLVVDIEMEHAR